MVTDAHTDRPGLPSRFSTNALVGVVFATGTCGGLGFLSPFSLASAVFDGGLALLVIAPPCALGFALTRAITRRALELRWQILVGSTFGLGGASLTMLGLGLFGALNRSDVIAIYAVMAAGSFVILASRAVIRRAARPEGSGVRGESPDSCDAADHEPARGQKPAARKSGVSCAGGVDHSLHPETESQVSKWWWIVLVPFLVLSAHAAAQAPGFLWREEGFGYDVLEYHLQVPREFVESGRIAYLPHNVYAMFPLNVEMLFAAAMLLRGDAIEAAVAANYIHLFLGVLAVFAVWVAAREWSAGSALVAAIAFGASGWIVYLSGLAYVEHGLLFFGAAATAATSRALRLGVASLHDATKSRAATRWTALAGALAGFACGCKYTAAPLIAAPLALAAMCRAAADDRWPARLGRGAVFVVSCLVTFGPWLARNVAETGNPVFPLANGWFQAAPPGFGAEESARWTRGHAPTGNKGGSEEGRNSAVVAGFGALVQKLALDPIQRFGPAILLTGIIGLIGRRRGPADRILLLLVVTQLSVWLLATHWFARFAVVTLIPLGLLAGRAITHEHGAPAHRRTLFFLTAILAGAAWNLAFAWRFVRAECLPAAPAAWFRDGRVPGFEYLATLNYELPKDARLLMVGDAKAFYVERSVDYFVVFNELPLARVMSDSASPPDVIRRLRDQKYTHMLVNWSEVRRLSATYGFAAEITPKRFESLRAAGLELWREFSLPGAPPDAPPYIHLHRVPAANDHGHDDGPS